MRPFPKRFYRRPADLFEDLRAAWRGRGRIRQLMKGETIDAAFRERLMLAVTEVNGCRYCGYAHARMALTAGLTESEVRSLLARDLQGSPPEQAPALLYAQHWAETNARPDAAARRVLLETYGTEQAEAIDLALRTIRIGNLTGNSLDYLLYRVSRGRWGGVESRD